MQIHHANPLGNYEFVVQQVNISDATKFCCKHCMKHPESFTSQTEGAENKLGAVKDGEAGALIVLVLPIFEAFKVLGVPSRTDLSDLRQVH